MSYEEVEALIAKLLQDAAQYDGPERYFSRSVETQLAPIYRGGKRIARPLEWYFGADPSCLSRLATAAALDGEEAIPASVMEDLEMLSPGASVRLRAAEFLRRKKPQLAAKLAKIGRDGAKLLQELKMDEEAQRPR